MFKDIFNLKKKKEGNTKKRKRKKMKESVNIKMEETRGRLWPKPDLAGEEEISAMAGELEQGEAEKIEERSG